MKLTPGRRAWLERLRDHGPARRPRGNVGYSCMHAGWTEWLFTMDDGSKLTHAQAIETWPHSETQHYWDHVIWTNSHEEIITEAGLGVLKAERPQ